MAQTVPLPLPTPPTLPPVAVPDPLRPAVAIAGPALAAPCGLVGLVPGLLGSQQASIPFEIGPLLPYLGPLVLACGLVPGPSTTHTCAVDAQVIAQVAALENQVFALLNVVPIPAPEGITIDTLLAANAAAGNPVPLPVIIQVADALSCTSGGDGAAPGGRPVADEPPAPAPALTAPQIEALAPVVYAAAVTRSAGAGVVAPEIRSAVRPVAAPVRLQHWRPLITVLLALALASLVGVAWRSERRDATRWRQEVP